MKVRSAGLKFKIANNFIWRVGRGVHHRDSTLPPYSWSIHGVNSESLFFSSIRRVEHRGVKRGDKVQVLFPRANRIQSVPCRVSVFIPSRLRHASRGQTRRPRASTDHPLACRFSEVLLTPKQTWRPRARKIKSVPCRISQSLLCFPLNPRANTTHSAPCLLSQNPPLRT